MSPIEKEKSVKPAPDSISMLEKRVVKKIGRPLGVRLFTCTFPNPLSLGRGRGGEVFDDIYSENYWGSGQSQSGVSSETAFAGRMVWWLVRSRVGRADAP